MNTGSSVSINKFNNLALVTLPFSLDDSLAQKLQSDITKIASEEQFRGIVIDISCLEIVDSYMTRILRDIANSVEIMGTPVVICGMRPEIAMTLVELGIHLPELATALGVDHALDKLDARSEDPAQTDSLDG